MIALPPELFTTGSFLARAYLPNQEINVTPCGHQIAEWEFQSVYYTIKPYIHVLYSVSMQIQKNESWN
jgi:hypothetical protein